MNSFKLNPEPPPNETAPLPGGPDGLTGAILLINARWFTEIRWIVVAVLTGFGAVGLLLTPELLGCFGLLPPGLWPLSLAGFLGLLNLGSTMWIRDLSKRLPYPWRGVTANIWFQIVSDLIVLSVLVFLVGTTNTVIAFGYLFHITLACIFFGRRDSFLVMLLSALFFLATVFMECTGLLPHPNILISAAAGVPDLVSAALFAVPTVFVWLVVWYLVSSLSVAVRRRDRELDAANMRLMRSDEEINLQMLRVTHDLKAPFSGIESNIQFLKHLYWNETPESVRQIIVKIEGRSMALRTRIGDILTLGSLRSSQSAERVASFVKLRELLKAVLHDVQSLATDKHLSVNLNVGNETVFSDPQQLKILLLNLVSNAIIYSRESGTVDIGIEGDATQVRVRVADHGIGISDQSLPHIFEDFYRAQEAANFNPNSTGLGLAIVRQIARNLRLTIIVESEPDKGTEFQVFIPKG